MSLKIGKGHEDVTKGQSCPCCGEELDSMAAVDGLDEPPENGDATVCAYCGKLLEFNDGKLVPISILSLHGDNAATIRELQAAVRKMNARKSRGG